MVIAAELATLGAWGALAQDTPTASADDTGRTIALVIGALLGLALLLAVLTFWYWRRTDPRRAARPTAAPISVTASPTAASTARPAGGRSVTARPAPRLQSGARPATRAQAGPSASPRGSGAGSTGRGAGAEGTAADRGISAEEWLRLTGARRPTPRDRT